VQERLPFWRALSKWSDGGGDNGSGDDKGDDGSAGVDG
jgi:hypothetical protein